MKKLQLPLLLLFLLAVKIGSAQSSAIVRRYIDTYKEVAIEEMKRTGVPAAITLAQGIHETAAGQSSLVKSSNNHFGIKCKTEWKGESVSYDDDAKGECFRKYADPRDSYRDHSDFLKNRPYYASLFLLDPTDYEGWAKGLKKAGYATNPKYAQILIKLIQDYGLQDYTMIALGRKVADQTEVWASANTQQNNDAKSTGGPNVEVTTIKQTVYPQGEFRINDTKVVFVAKGTPYLMVAEQYHVKLSRIYDFNDLQESEIAPNDQLVYLQRKRKKGAHDFYTVKGNESLQQVAQEEGIRLESLLRFNGLQQNMQPAVGSLLYLQKDAPEMPKLATAAPKQSMATVPVKNAKQSATLKEDTFVVHTVQSKETMYSIAKQYAVNVDDVLKWNNLESPYLKTGQKLRINKKRS